MAIDADAITKQMQSAFTYEESLQIAFDAFMLPEVATSLHPLDT